MLKNFHNFVLESNIPMNNKTIDVRDLYNRYNNNVELVCNELNRTLLNRQIRISEIIYDDKKNMFKWNYITPKFFNFEFAGSYMDRYYLRFNDGCMFELSPGLQIEHRLLIFDN